MFVVYFLAVNFDWSIILIRKSLGASRHISGKLGVKLAINNGNNVCALKGIDLLVLQVSHVVLARGQEGRKLFDNLSAFRPCFFMKTLPILMGISAFSMRVAPIILFPKSAPIPFSPFLSTRGA